MNLIPKAAHTAMSTMNADRQRKNTIKHINRKDWHLYCRVWKNCYIICTISPL